MSPSSRASSTASGQKVRKPQFAVKSTTVKAEPPAAMKPTPPIRRHHHERPAANHTDEEEASSSDDEDDEDDEPLVGSRCTVCRLDLDEITITCSQCHVETHPSCYGVNPEKLPGGGRKGCEAPQFLCLACLQLKEAQATTTCALCGHTGGLLKPTERKGHWAHIDCSWHIPEFWIEDGKITGFDYVPKSRSQLTCRICSKKMGFCIQCDYAGSISKAGKREHPCTVPFHVSCAKRAKEQGYRVWVQYVYDERDPDDYEVAKLAFCPQHFTARFDSKAWLQRHRASISSEQAMWAQLKKEAAAAAKSERKGKKRKADHSQTDKRKARKVSEETTAPSSGSPSSAHVTSSACLDDSVESSHSILTNSILTASPARAGRATRNSGGHIERNDLSTMSLVPPMTPPQADLTSPSTEKRRRQYYQRHCKRLEEATTNADANEEMTPTAMAETSAQIASPIVFDLTQDPLELLSSMPPLAIGSESLSPDTSALPMFSERAHHHYEPAFDGFATLSDIASRVLSPILVECASARRSMLDTSDDAASPDRSSAPPLLEGTLSVVDIGTSGESISAPTQTTDAEKENMAPHKPCWFGSSTEVTPRTPTSGTVDFLRTPSSLQSRTTQKTDSHSHSTDAAAHPQCRLSPLLACAASDSPPAPIALPRIIQSKVPVPTIKIKLEHAAEESTRNE